jgi:hypothetical protein
VVALISTGSVSGRLDLGRLDQRRALISTGSISGGCVDFDGLDQRWLR